MGYLCRAYVGPCWALGGHVGAILSLLGQELRVHLGFHGFLWRVEKTPNMFSFCWRFFGVVLGGYIGIILGLCGTYDGPMLVHVGLWRSSFGHVGPMLGLCWSMLDHVRLLAFCDPQVPFQGESFLTPQVAS